MYTYRYILMAPANEVYIFKLWVRIKRNSTVYVRQTLNNVNEEEDVDNSMLIEQNCPRGLTLGATSEE